MEWYHVYLFTRLDGLNTFFGITAIFLGICVVIITAILPLIIAEGDFTLFRFIRSRPLLPHWSPSNPNSKGSSRDLPAAEVGKV